MRVGLYVLTVYWCLSPWVSRDRQVVSRVVWSISWVSMGLFSTEFLSFAVKLFLGGKWDLAYELRLCSQTGLHMTLLPWLPTAGVQIAHHNFWFFLPQVNLKTGVPPDSNNETCTAGAGSLLVEFGILSRLLGDSTFEWVARRAVKALWSLRSNNTGLLGRVHHVPSVGLCNLWSPFPLPLYSALSFFFLVQMDQEINNSNSSRWCCLGPVSSHDLLLSVKF